MTLEEKRTAVEKWCHENNVPCGDCPISKVINLSQENCYSEGNEHIKGADVERNYRLLFGEIKAEVINKLEKHALICDEIKELYQRKNADYGDSFHTTFLEEGMAMPRIRLTDKLERFKRLTKSNEQNVKDESVRDTLIDLANYAIMTVLEMECEQKDAEK